MIVAGKRRPKSWIWPAGIGRAGIIKNGGQTLQAFTRLAGIPVGRHYVAARAGITPASRQAPIFHRRYAVSINPLETSMSGDHRFCQKLRAAPLCDVRSTRCAPSLIVENSQPTFDEPVDAVGASGESHRPFGCVDIDLSCDLRMAFVQPFTPPRLGLDEPCRHRLEGRPPEEPDGGDIPVGIEQPAGHGKQFGRRILGQRAARERFHERCQRIMNKVAAKCRIDRAVDIVKLAKRQHTTRIKAVGVRYPVVDLGG